MGTLKDRIVVELVKFGMFCGLIGTVPATRWRGTAHTTVGIEGSVSSEDPVNGWQRGDITGVLLEQFAADGGCAKFTKVAVVTQLLPEIKYQILTGIKEPKKTFTESNPLNSGGAYNGWQDL